MKRFTNMDEAQKYIRTILGMSHLIKQIIFLIEETSKHRRQMINPVDFSPTGKGCFVFFTPEQGQAAKAVFEKIILALLRYFFEKPCTV